MALSNIAKPNGLRIIMELCIDKEGNNIAPAQFAGPHFDGSPTTFITDTTLFRDLFDIDRFPKFDLAYNSFKIIIGEGLVTSKGEIWKKERRLLTPLFHFAKLKQMPNIMLNRIDTFCNQLRNLNGENVRVCSLFGELALQVVVDCVFGGERYVPVKIMDKLWERTNIALNNYFISAMFLGNPINSLCPFPWNLEISSCIKQIRKLIDDAIDLKLKDLEEDDEDSDLLASLLKVRDNETGKAIPKELIKDESLTFLFAGHDTTSALLSWCMLFLAHNPNVVKKLREEISQILGSKEKPSFEDIKEFHYCEMILKETLRMRPPVPFLARTVSSTCKIGDNTYQKGSTIYPIIFNAHYDNRFWKQPYKFRPERFDKNNKDEPQTHPYSFIPFSAGKRNCIGKKFSMMEAVLALVQIIKQFDIITEQSIDDVLWEFEGTMKPVNFKCSFKPIE